METAVYFLMLAISPTDAGILSSAVHSSWPSLEECVAAEVRLEQLDPSGQAHLFCVDFNGLVKLREGDPR